MIQRNIKYSLMGSIALIAPVTQANEGVIIESISKFDGIFFTADTIEILRKYQRSMLSLINGERLSDGSYHGKYAYKGNNYGAHDLAKIEQELEAQKETLSPEVYAQEKAILNAILVKIIHDFKNISHEFEVIIRDAKAIVSKFVKESCLQRNRPDSLLIQWSHTDEGKEFDVFKKEADTLIKFDQFCIDLLNFFNDLIRSCPKAKQAFDARVVKWKKIREVIAVIKQSGRTFDEGNFLKHIKQDVLDGLEIHAITTDSLLNLLQKFER